MQDDLFGHVPRKGELLREPMPVAAPIRHTPETIRAEMHAILAEARAADVLPWAPRWVRKHTAASMTWPDGSRTARAIG